MRIYLARHARAEPRAGWTGEDLLRPLTARGLEQALDVADELADEPPARIVCGPALRCQQTVEPLAIAHGIPVEVDERLAQDAGAARTLELLPGVDRGPILFCTHADVVLSLLRVLELHGDDPAEPLPCKKGSIWVLRGQGCTPTRARYVEPTRRRRKGAKSAARDASRPRSLRAAVLDLGSTSFNLLIADVRRDGTLTPIVREKVMLRLGEVIATRREIPDDVSERAVEAARALARVAKTEKVQKLLPVATSALREASNGVDVSRRIGAVLEQPVRILSGAEEARTMFRAFRRRLALGDDPLLALDLGGGSLELAVGRDGEIETEASLELGAVRLRAAHVASDPMGPAGEREIRERVDRELAPVAASFRSAGLRHAVVSGGAVRALGRLLRERERVDAADAARVELDLATLTTLGEELVASTHAERLAMRGMRRQRVDAVPVAAVVLTQLARTLDLEGFTICDWGLREGVLLGAFSRS